MSVLPHYGVALEGFELRFEDIDGHKDSPALWLADHSAGLPALALDVSLEESH